MVLVHDNLVHDQTPYSFHMMLGILRMLRPHKVAGTRKIRLGRFFDGGYVMLDRFEGVSVAYSLGINDDVSWDLDIARRGIPLFQYDHTIDALPMEHPLFHWEKVGISHVPQPELSLETLPDLIARNGHQDRTDMILKCDIEQHEWAVFEAMPNAIVRQFRQIVMEVHCLGRIADMSYAHRVRAAVENLTMHHKLVHVHANNFAPWSVVGGVPVPDVLEITLVRDDQGEFSASDEIFPGPLDMPCYTLAADHYLGRFVYD